MAKKLAADVHSHGGLLTEADLAAYKVVDRKPLTGTFTTHGKTYDVITSPPPSSGGIVLLETLNILSGYDLPALGPDRSPAQIHYITGGLPARLHGPRRLPRRPRLHRAPLAQMAAQKYADAWRKSILPDAPSPSATLKRPAGFLPPPPRGHAAQGVHPDHALQRRRLRRHGRVDDLHPERPVRLRRHRARASASC